MNACQAYHYHCDTCTRRRNVDTEAVSFKTQTDISALLHHLIHKSSNSDSSFRFRIRNKTTIPTKIPKPNQTDIHYGKVKDSSVENLLPDFDLVENLEKRVEEIGKWERREFRVHGNSWDVSSVDGSAAGLGWFAVGLRREAVLGVWTYDGVDVTVGNSLIPQRSQFFEVAGFTVSKIVSTADRASNKQHQGGKKQKKQNDQKKEAVSDPSPLTDDADAVNTDAGSC